MPSANINGVDLYFETRGSGPPCLVIHGGLGLDHQYLSSTLTPLEDHLSLVHYDQRGNGQSGRPDRETITMEQLADDAAALLGQVAEPPAIVLGHSYGGFVAQELALRHPGLVRALILADTTPGQLGTDEREDEQEQGPPLPTAMVELMSTVPESDSAMAYLMQGILPYYIHGIDTAAAEAAVEGTRFSAEALVRGFEILASWSSVDRLPSIWSPRCSCGGGTTSSVRRHRGSASPAAFPTANCTTSKTVATCPGSKNRTRSSQHSPAGSNGTGSLSPPPPARPRPRARHRRIRPARPWRP